MSALDIVTALSSVRRSVQLYPPTHPSYRESIEAVVAAVRDCVTADGGFVLNTHEGRLYDGSQVIAADAPGVASLEQTLERHRVESLTFDAAFSASDAVALAEVLNLRPNASLHVDEELANRGVTSIVVGTLAAEDETEREERDARREKDRALYRQLVAAMRSVNQTVSTSGSPDLDQAAEMVGGIMSRLVEDDAAVLGMATLNQHDESALFHSVNVMIYSLTLGIGLGLPDDGLMALGIAALMHDIGKAPYDLSDPAQAREAWLLHPKIGAEVLSRLPDEDPSMMLVAFEHHMGADGSGWPEREVDYFTHPYSRMVSIADRFENLTKRGDGDAGPLTPDRAVMQLLREGGHALDPIFTRIFVRALGVFPIGCVVRLSDQSVGVVRATTSELLSPIVLVVYDANGMELEDPADADLTSDPRTIVEVIDPAALDMQVSDRL